MSWELFLAYVKVFGVPLAIIAGLWGFAAWLDREQEKFYIKTMEDELERDNNNHDEP